MLVLSGHDLDLAAVGAVAMEGTTVQLDEKAMSKVDAAHTRVQQWGVQGEPIYGVNTGFGETVNMAIPARFATDLQMNLVRGHAAGAGPFVSTEVSRAIMLARANCLVRGYSGTSPATLQLLVDLLNNGVHPLVPEQGSLGASGDLAPLSHVALVLCGLGEAMVADERLPGHAALARHGLTPANLGFKEGLSLINGTSAMTGAAAIALLRGYRLLELEIHLSALFVQALRGSRRAFDPRGHELRGHPGQIRVAALLQGLLEGGQLTVEHGDLMAAVRQERGNGSEVVDTGVQIQNAYTLRCVPQILGPVLDTLAYCTGIVQTELNSCNDNPLIFDTAEDTFHGGNFHGQYVAMACDYLAIAITEIGVLAERQLDRLLDPHRNGALPSFLVRGDSGLGAGLMGAQYLATSIASENLDLAAPSSVKSIPSNGGNQDVVSMGFNAARRCLRLCDNVQRILTVLAAACFQASSIIGAEKFSPTGAAWLAELADRGSAFNDDEEVGAFLRRIEAALGGPATGTLLREHVGLSPAK